MDTQTLVCTLLIMAILCVFRNDILSVLNMNQSTEPFFDVRSELIQAIADKLLISPRRILNFTHTGDVSKNKLNVGFGIGPRTSLESYEPSNSELLDTISHLFDTNMFVIVYQDKIINLSSNNQIGSKNKGSSNPFTNTDTNTNINNVKPKEKFEQYYCNVDTKFDNTNLLRVKNMVDAGYRNFPYDESLTNFIELDSKNGKMNAINSLSSCPT